MEKILNQELARQREKLSPPSANTIICGRQGQSDYKQPALSNPAGSHMPTPHNVVLKMCEEQLKPEAGRPQMQQRNKNSVGKSGIEANLLLLQQIPFPFGSWERGTNM